jgi:protein Mpv17
MIRTFAKSSMNLLSRYNNSILRAPYKTKMATAGTTYFIADNICQRFIEKKSSEQYSFTRSLRQAAVGALFAAPSLHIWHSGILPKLIKPIAGKMKGVLVAVFLNETVLASYFIGCLLFSFEALKHLNPQAGVKNVKEKFGSAIVTSMKFWTGISFINYGLMPIHLRPVFVSCWSVVWQSYLSYVSNNKVMLDEKKGTKIVVVEEEDPFLTVNRSSLRLI